MAEVTARMSYHTKVTFFYFHAISSVAGRSEVGNKKNCVVLYCIVSYCTVLY
jgi:hypothetical protein